MNINDYVFIIKPNDQYYGEKFIIRGIQTDFSGKITGYTVNGNGGKYRDYMPQDVQYTTKKRTKFTSQMQLL